MMTVRPIQPHKTHTFPLREECVKERGEWFGRKMKKHIVHYNPRLKELARQLRRNSTLAEVLLWIELKGKQMMGYDFHRQKPYDEYILDFFCPRLMLAVEIDGDSHVFKEERDAERQRRLEGLGVRFLRFDDLDVKSRMEDVLMTIRKWIEEHRHGTIRA